MRTLTPRENFHRMVRHDDPQWLPMMLPVTDPIADLIQRHYGTRNSADAFDLDFGGVGVRLPRNDDAWRRAYAQLGVTLPDNIEIDAIGITHRIPPREDVGAAYHFRELLHPMETITSVEQLEALPWPGVSDPQCYAHLDKAVAAIHERGRVAAGALACTVFETAWYVRGMDALFMDLVEGNGADRRSIGDWLLDWQTSRSLAGAIAYAKAGVDVIQLGDDVGTQRGMMMSVDFWRHHLKPRLAKVIDGIRTHQQDRLYVHYHSDGDVRPIIDDLADIGVDILNPIQPECMPLDEVIPRHQHHLAFCGMVGTQTTMPFGTVDEVRASVRQCADFARRGAAIILAPTHVLEPDVPWENILALVDEVRTIELSHDS